MSSRITELLVELMTDDEGRPALTGLLADELAKKELTVRGLHVVDDQGRERLTIYAKTVTGGVTIHSFGEDAPRMELLGDEESSKPGVSLSMTDEHGLTFLLSAVNADPPGGEGGTWLTFEDDEGTGAMLQVSKYGIEQKPPKRSSVA